MNFTNQFFHYKIVYQLAPFSRYVMHSPASSNSVLQCFFGEVPYLKFFRLTSTILLTRFFVIRLSDPPTHKRPRSTRKKTKRKKKKIKYSDNLSTSCIYSDPHMKPIKYECFFTLGHRIFAGQVVGDVYEFLFSHIPRMINSSFLHIGSPRVL